MKGSRRWLVAAVACAVVLPFGGRPAGAQEFNSTTENQTTTKEAPKPGASEQKKDATAGLGQRRDREVTIAEQLSFREQQVHEDMSELEQRMFRLSEALKKLEPENSSRLIIGWKFARQELILHQMQEVRKALASLSLKGAVEEQKQLVAKLERLQQMLLSTDLDFEMRLERLKQIRETLRALDLVIKEESREEKTSQKAAEMEKKLASLAKRKAALEELVKRQTEHVEKNTPLARQENLSEPERGEVDKLGKEQEATRKDTQALADELVDGAKSKNLVGAAGDMQSAVDALAKTAPAEAQPPMEKALAELKKELKEVARQEAEAQQALAKEKFEAMRKDQEANRGANDQVSEMTRQLGSNGTAALAELLRAGSCMGGAEGAFGNCQGGPGNGEQKKALSSLKYAKELLAEEAERLARQLRAEVKKRVMDGLTLMLEMQTAVRERTEALAAGVKRGSREALVALASLAKREEKITAAAQELINIVEETEFGIALPAALAAVRDATEVVEASLAAGDASSDVIKAEKQIEADLKAMLEIVSEMSDANSRQGRRRAGNSPQELRKELNRIVSELRMLRLLETRVRENTVQVDARRAADTSLSAEMRRRIEQLEGRQSDIKEATELLAVERGDELPQPE
ncbi:MAG: hypothetical protein WD063_20390 [Pirellulales bacterium]